MAKEIKETETQNSDMMKLIIEKKLQIKQMEEQMEKLVKEKEESINNIQNLVDVVSLAVVSITTVSTTTTTSATGTTKGVEQLIEVVHNLPIQIGEINQLKDELKELWLMKSISDSSHTTETNRLKGQVEMLKKELTDSFIGNKFGLAK